MRANARSNPCGRRNTTIGIENNLRFTPKTETVVNERRPTEGRPRNASLYPEPSRASLCREASNDTPIQREKTVKPPHGREKRAEPNATCGMSQRPALRHKAQTSVRDKGGREDRNLVVQRPNSNGEGLPQNKRPTRTNWYETRRTLNPGIFTVDDLK